MVYRILQRDYFGFKLCKKWRNIPQVIFNVSQAQISRVFQNNFGRCQKCTESGRGHFEHLSWHRSDGSVFTFKLFIDISPAKQVLQTEVEMAAQFAVTVRGVQKMQLSLWCERGVIYGRSFIKKTCFISRRFQVEKLFGIKVQRGRKIANKIFPAMHYQILQLKYLAITGAK